MCPEAPGNYYQVRVQGEVGVMRLYDYEEFIAFMRDHPPYGTTVYTVTVWPMEGDDEDEGEG